MTRVKFFLEYLVFPTCGNEICPSKSAAKLNLITHCAPHEVKKGAYLSVGIKVLGYLVLVNMRVSTGRSFHQIQMELSGQRKMFGAIMAHFHEHEYGRIRIGIDLQSILINTRQICFPWLVLWRGSQQDYCKQQIHTQGKGVPFIFVR